MTLDRKEERMVAEEDIKRLGLPTVQAVYREGGEIFYHIPLRDSHVMTMSEKNSMSPKEWQRIDFFYGEAMKDPEKKETWLNYVKDLPILEEKEGINTYGNYMVKQLLGVENEENDGEALEAFREVAPLLYPSGKLALGLAFFSPFLTVMEEDASTLFMRAVAYTGRDSEYFIHLCGGLFNGNGMVKMVHPEDNHEDIELALKNSHYLPLLLEHFSPTQKRLKELFPAKANHRRFVLFSGNKEVNVPRNFRGGFMRVGALWHGNEVVKIEPQFLERKINGAPFHSLLPLLEDPKRVSEMVEKIKETERSIHIFDKSISRATAVAIEGAKYLSWWSGVDITDGIETVAKEMDFNKKMGWADSV